MTERLRNQDNDQRLLRRRHVLGATGVGLTAAIAGCGSSDDNEDPVDDAGDEPQSDDPDNGGEDDATDEGEDDATDEGEDDEKEEEVSMVLPPDCSLLFEDGELSDEKFVDGERQDRDFPAGSFTKDQVGTPVSEFDLEACI